MRREMGEHVLFGTIMAINPGIVIILVPIVSPMIQKYESFWIILAGESENCKLENNYNFF